MSARGTLDSRTVQAVEELLKAKHATLTGAIRNLIGQRRTDDGRPDSDLVSATLDDAIHVELLGRHHRQLAEIEAALERLGQGAYGFCRDCDTFIGLGRLKALPFASRCSRCQDREESGALSGAAGRRH